MTLGDVEPVPGCTDLYYVDVDMYGTEKYGAVYLVDAERPAVVDTGTGLNRETIYTAVEEYLGGDPEYVLPTHAHLDHAGGTGFLLDRYPEAHAYTHDRAVPHLVDPGRLVEGTKAAVGDQWEFYVEPRPVPEDRISAVGDGDELDLGDRTLHVHEAPGHATHQVVFHDDRDDVLFAGDAAGIWVPQKREVNPTSPPSTFNLEGCLDDVRTIEDIDPDHLCYGHFGPVGGDLVTENLETFKRVLVEWVEAVRQKRRELDDDEAVVQHFVDNARNLDVWPERKARAEARLNTRGVLAYLDYVGDD